MPEGAERPDDLGRCGDLGRSGAADRPERLSALDASFLYVEQPETPMHVGGVALLDQPATGSLDVARLRTLVGSRLDRLPRYRQVVRPVPGRLARPVWVDTEPDLDWHVRRHELPSPGTEAQLAELVAAVHARPLDRDRPLWEIHLVEGLAGGRLAIVTKTHHAVADGIGIVDLGTALLDPTAESGQETDPPAAAWSPRPAPDDEDLVTAALDDWAAGPRALLTAMGGLRTGAGARLAGARLGGVLAAVRSASSPAPASPLNTPIGPGRRFATAATSLADYERVRARHGGTVNDVVLATVAGALRRWLETRDESAYPAGTLRALVPVSLREAGERGGNRVSSYLLDLPVSERDPVRRLHQISAAMDAHKREGQANGLTSLVVLAGLAPPVVHAAAARLASGLTRHLFNLVISNVPGPSTPLYAAGAPMRAAYPVLPLAKGQALSVGLTSYHGGVFYGLTADRDALHDVNVVARCLSESLDELVETL